MARPKVTFSEYQYNSDKQAVKYRLLFTLGVFTNGYTGLQIWAFLYPHWAFGAWIVLVIFAGTALMLFFSALKGWKLWFQRRHR